MILGNLSQERYQKMLEGYEAEQAALNNEVIGLEDWVATREEMEDNVDQFLALMEKYVDIPEQITIIVNEFVKQIIIYTPDESSGKRTQIEAPYSMDRMEIVRSPLMAAVSGPAASGHGA